MIYMNQKEFKKATERKARNTKHLTIIINSDFHDIIKIRASQKNCSLKQYIMQALLEKMQRDEANKRI